MNWLSTGLPSTWLNRNSAGQHLHQDQQINDDVRQRGQGIVAHSGAGIESHEEVELKHRSDPLPLLTMDGEVSVPPRPEIAFEKPINPERKRPDQHESRDHVHEPHFGHQEGGPAGSG